MSHTRGNWCLLIGTLLLCFACNGLGPDPLIGMWYLTDGTGGYEFLEDGTAILASASSSKSAEWSRLPDDRVKLEWIEGGTEEARVFLVRLEEGRLTLASSDGLRMEFARANHRAAQKRTVGDIRNVGAAWFSWLTDQVGAAAGGQQTYDLGSLRVIEASELEKILFPSHTFFYIMSVPETDGWGGRYEYRIEPSLRGTHVLAIRSPGSDGVFDRDEYPAGPFPATQYDRDIVWTDGFFIQYPSGAVTGTPR